MSRLLILFAVLFGAGAVLALQPPVPPRPADKGKSVERPKSDEVPPPRKEVRDGPAELEARFSDDSVLKVTPIDQVVVVQTKYGKLSVVLADITRIEFGFRFPEGAEAKVEEAITNLGAASFRDREAAEKALFGLAELAVPALKRAAKNNDPEVSRRAEAVLKRLQDKLPPEKLELKDYDLVETPELMIRGRVESGGIRVKTKLFGETTMRLTELRALRSTAAVGNEFEVDGAKYARPNGTVWLDTGVDITSDQALEIIATGTLDLGPNQPGQYTSTPAGNPQNGMGPVIRTPSGRTYRFVPGSLVARIGTAETPFVVGQQFKAARPPAEGRLFLSVTPSAWGTDSTGSYKVKVRIGG